MTKYILAVAICLFLVTDFLVAQPKPSRSGSSQVRPNVQRLPPPKSLDEIKQQMQSQRGPGASAPLAPSNGNPQGVGNMGNGPPNIPNDPGPVPIEGLGYLLAAGALFGFKKVRDLTSKKG